MRRRHAQHVARVRVPNDQAPLFHVPGPHGGWFASLLYGHGSSVDVSMRALRKLIAGSPGQVIVARRLTRPEQELLERERGDSDAGVHARIVVKEEERFRRPRAARKSI
ncbi:MAG TPA: hypothetical protein VHN14_36805 [Kofleriaceae bacterium]|nr:hypothetical protein [Kofleriaceae bacterium]